MQKREALQLLGGTVSATARACGISPSAVSQWPDELTREQRDRVEAALWRLSQASPKVLEGLHVEHPTAKG